MMEAWIHRGIICWTVEEFFVLMDYVYEHCLASSDRTNIVYNDTVTNNDIGCKHFGCYWMVLE